MSLFFAMANTSLCAELSLDQLELQYPEQIIPLVQKYCLGCHSAAEMEGELDLERFKTAANVRSDTHIWQNVLRRLRDGEMPPEDEPQPAPDQRRQLIDWTENYLMADAQERAGDPGLVLMRRLTRAEYNYTIRDLTGVDLRPAQNFLEDSVAGEGFANTGESLFMAPDLIPKYLDAARQVASHAVLTPSGISFSPSNDPHDWVAETAQSIKDFYSQYTDQEGRLPLADYLEVTLRYRDLDPSEQVSLEDFIAKHYPSPERKLSPKYVRLLWNALNASQPKEELAEVVRQWRNSSTVAVKRLNDAKTHIEMEASSDPADSATFQLTPPLIATITDIQQQLWKFNEQMDHQFGSMGLFGSHVIPLEDESQKQKIESDTYSAFAELFPLAVCFAPVFPVNGDVTVELYLREDEAMSRLLLDEREHEHLDRLWDELVYISQAPIEQLHNTIEFINFQPSDRSESIKIFEELIPSMEKKAADFEKSARATQPTHLTALLELASRAWRRPLSESEEHELRHSYEMLCREQELSHDAALRTLLTRVLVSPNFLYRVERPSSMEETVALTDWELASRLSYFLWSTLPDDRLRESAAAGGLQDQEVLVTETSRMLKDSRMRALAIEFAGQWLQFRSFDQHDNKSETRFPTFTPELRAAMNQEATDFVAEIVRNDRSILEILQADYTYLNDELARHYDIPNIEGPEFRRVENVSRFGRGGLAAMGSVLATQSGASRTSPVLRGTWVVETLLGREIPNPPADVPQLAEDELNKDGLTMRQRVERHRADASCAVCHDKIDPYGFALEGYDPIGRLRDEDLYGNPIDAQAEPRDGEAFAGLSGLQGYLLEHQDEFTKQFCRKLLGYALGRTVELSDGPLLVEMQTELKENEYRFSAAVLPLIKSSQFRRHRGMEATRVAND